MGKVISLDKLRNRNKNKRGSDGLSYDSLAYYKKLLNIKSGIMDELFVMTEDMLKEYGCDIEKFNLVEKSAKEYLLSDILEFATGGEEALSLVYEGIIDGVKYRSWANASCDGEKIDI